MVTKHKWANSNSESLPQSFLLHPQYGVSCHLPHHEAKSALHPEKLQAHRQEGAPEPSPAEPTAERRPEGVENT